MPPLRAVLLAATLGIAALSGILLVPGHYVLWLRWQNRWPPELLDHCEALAERESGAWVPLSELP